MVKNNQHRRKTMQNRIQIGRWVPLCTMLVIAATLAPPVRASTDSKNASNIAVDRPAAIPITDAAQLSLTMTDIASIEVYKIVSTTSTTTGGVNTTYAITAPRVSSTSLLAGVAPGFYGGCLTGTASALMHCQTVLASSGAETAKGMVLRVCPTQLAGNTFDLNPRTSTVVSCSQDIGNSLNTMGGINNTGGTANLYTS